MSELHEVAGRGDLDGARAMLAADPYLVTRRDDYKRTPLHLAAAGGRLPLVELLLQRSADVDARDYGGSTALHAAAEGGHAETVGALLAHAARPNLFDRSGDTPLHKAARAGDLQTARLLLDGGADPDAMGPCGGAPLHAAAEAGRTGMAELLLAHDALANARSTAHDERFTPWDAAVQAGHGALADLLLRHGGADKAAGPIAIDRAAALGYDARIRTLLARDPAQVSSRDLLHGRTPLHWAAAAGRGSIAELLLEHGADAAAPDRRGRTPAELADAAGFGELAARLRAQGR